MLWETPDLYHLFNKAKQLTEPLFFLSFFLATQIHETRVATAIGRKRKKNGNSFSGKAEDV